MSTVMATPATGSPIADGCGGWRVETVAQGLEQLENLEPDARGGVYLAGDSKVYHVDADGRVSTVVEHMAAPGGLQLDGSGLYFLTRQDAKLWQLDTATGQLTDRGALGGNGLLRLPGGDLLTTWVGTEGGPPMGVTRYRSDSGHVEPNWSPVPRGEGLAASPDGRFVYTDDLFTGQIYRVPLDDPERWSVVTRIPGLLPGADDLTMSRSGVLYVAAHIEGAIYGVDPETGASCVVASGLSNGWQGPSSVRIGRAGDGWALYVTSFDGTLRRMHPPTGVDLAPSA
ncbi:SMP-30/gluconolactonase/LRE family protein [Prescottella agglutinans]|uniref:SMP-30/gluconolactonase/LRE family protein n=1 Tax=Prescottella agglutinans TaxID=1644129 RepID=UPI003D96A90A